MKTKEQTLKEEIEIKKIIASVPKSAFKTGLTRLQIRKIYTQAKKEVIEEVMKIIDDKILLIKIFRTTNQGKDFNQEKIERNSLIIEELEGIKKKLEELNGKV